ncbi:MAG: hypothetical protein JWN18_72 [Parcubacteria group bacterium]|nr:hypothetical protein [Parcubacteria group bacterium]
MWKQWINALLGAVITISAFVGTNVVGADGTVGSGVSWTLAIMGIAVLVLSLWSATEVSKEDYDRVTQQRHSHA